MRPIKPGTRTKDLFPSEYFSKGALEELPDKRFTGVIQSVYMDDLFNPHAGQESEETIISFPQQKDLPFKLVLKPVIAGDIEEATGTDVVSDWPGKSITLYIGSYRNKAAMRAKAGQAKSSGERKPLEPEQLKKMLNKVAGGYEKQAASDDDYHAVWLLLNHLLGISEQPAETSTAQVNKFLEHMFDDWLEIGQALALFRWATGQQELNPYATISPPARQEAEKAAKAWSIL